ncbi:MAG: hemerythrin [Caulobacter sp.]|nr:hemerythrin [Caulobacter sp.]
MAATTHTTKGKSKSSATAKKATPTNAITLLKADHKQVKTWFDDYEKTEADTLKAKLSEQICQALKVHMAIEEEYFYPASREVLKADQEDMVDEAVVEHAGAKELIVQIEAMEVGEELYDAKIKVLGEQITHHVEEEEGEYFPAVQKTDLDLEALGAKMAARKEELMAKTKRANGQKIQ